MDTGNSVKLVQSVNKFQRQLGECRGRLLAGFGAGGGDSAQSKIVNVDLEPLLEAWDLDTIHVETLPKSRVGTMLLRNKGRDVGCKPTSVAASVEAINQTLNP